MFQREDRDNEWNEKDREEKWQSEVERATAYLHTIVSLPFFSLRDCPFPVEMEKSRS